jgi:hypothetical protein
MILLFETKKYNKVDVTEFSKEKIDELIRYDIGKAK